MTKVDRALAIVFAGVFLLPCSACSQKWKFARHHAATAPVIADGAAILPGPRLQTQAGGGLSGPVDRVSTAAGGFQPMPPHAFRTGPGQLQVANAAFYPMQDPAAAFEPGVGASGSPGTLTFSMFDPGRESLPPERSSLPYDDSCASPHSGSRLHSMWQQAKGRICSDHANYYSYRTMRDLALGIAAASPVANTSWDADFQSWYQRDVRSSGTDDFAVFWKTFGEGDLFIPAFAGLALLGTCFEDRPVLGTAGNFSARVTRGYLVGTPPMLLMQATLGASRPIEMNGGSHWKPFDDNNGVSGHAFMGSVPLITAAKMVENPWAKSALYVFSTFPAWSRINDDHHYLSQVSLGWWMGYLACRAVEGTELANDRVVFTPLVTPEMAGVGMIVRR